MEIPSLSGSCLRHLTSDPSLLRALAAEDFEASWSSAALRGIGARLELSSAERVEYNAQVFRLTDLLQERLHVARFYVSGSYGRRVTVGHPPQIDLVIFLRNAQKLPPYNQAQTDLLPRLHEVLTSIFASKLDVQVRPLVHPGCELPQLVGDRGRCDVRGSKRNNHSCAEEYISLSMGGANFRILVAPALGRNSEEQRQATYRHMEAVFVAAGGGAAGLRALSGWHPALLERPSEAIAHAPAEVQAFIRVCQLWVRTQKIESFDRYAVEALAYGIARTLGAVGATHLNTSDRTTTASSVNDAPANSSSLRNRRNAASKEGASVAAASFDLSEAFAQFLFCCQDLTRVNAMFDIEPPAAYTNAWVAADEPVLTDRFNPYKNLLDSLTAEDRLLLAGCATEKLRLVENPTNEDFYEGPTVLAVFRPSEFSITRRSKNWRGGVRVFSLAVLLCLFALLLINVFLSGSLNSRASRLLMDAYAGTRVYLHPLNRAAALHLHPVLERMAKATMSDLNYVWKSVFQATYKLKTLGTAAGQSIMSRLGPHLDRII